ncbi:hypothetical protein E6C60_1729 [Paenibacillus algicola]|uniref:Uncharacterized protein n=1 Tax=Paenibacillus algicola TaxID=2565926 RepID=A0A4V1G3U8_9BACL|nr:hypothetical protein E6C60_1729 [Paenibacillus algicola]
MLLRTCIINGAGTPLPDVLEDMRKEGNEDAYTQHGGLFGAHLQAD